MHNKPIVTKSRSVTKKGHKGTLGDDRNVLYLDCGGRHKGNSFVKIH